jgi:hypothetical protein
LNNPIGGGQPPYKTGKNFDGREFIVISIDIESKKNTKNKLREFLILES